MNFEIHGVPDEIAERLRLEFLEDAGDRLDRIEEAVDAAGGNTLDETEALTVLRREAHNLKGMGGSFNFPLITVIAHRLEDYLCDVSGLDRRRRKDADIFVDEMRAVIAAGVNPNETGTDRILRRLPAKWSTQTGAASSRDHEILLVTESKVADRIIGASLQEDGYRVVSTRSVFEAIQMAVTMRPDMVIAAAVMAGLGGVDLARGFSAMSALRDMPFALMTSFAPGSPELAGLPPNVAVIRKGDSYREDLAMALGRLRPR